MCVNGLCAWRAAFCDGEDGRIGIGWSVGCLFLLMDCYENAV